MVAVELFIFTLKINLSNEYNQVEIKYFKKRKIDKKIDKLFSWIKSA